MPRRLISWFARHGYLLAVLAIVVSTALFRPGRDTFANGQWALLYLLIVVLVAGASGAGPAIVAAVLAFFAWDFFFLPPYHTLLVREPKDYLSLFAFLVVGVVMGLQTGRMRDREAQALAREHETAALNRLSAGLVSQA
jgi:two-component system, OmpR family, sensor histidine kinase KdpD